MQRQGHSLDSNKKIKIASEVLMEFDPNFKIKLLDAFRSNLLHSGIDLNNLCFSQEAKKSLDSQYNTSRKTNIDIFDPNILNQIITLPNGKVMTIDEYLERNHVWSLIPLNSIVTLQALGISMSGSKFIENIIKRADKFNDIQEFFKAYDVIINRNNYLENTQENIEIGNSVHR